MKYTSVSVFGAAMLALAPSVTAHMTMAQPVPFGHPNNSPLDPSGSDYPCKLNGGSGTLDITTMNNFKVGENQTLSFSGSAVHGGGSCQLAVTLDETPTKDSKFKVIHSIEGGCPGVSGPSTFSFGVPKDLPNGKAVFAWTWFNHVGNREMYMNCAPITVSGGSDDKSAFDKLPDMAIANINAGTGASCKTTESFDYTFENPGASVEKSGAGPFMPLCGGAASGGSTPGQSAAAPAGPAQTPNNGLYSQPAASAPAASQAPAASSAAPAAPSQAPAVSSQAPANPAPSAAVTSTVHTLVTVTAPQGASGAASTDGASAPAPVASAAPSAQPSSAPGAGSGAGGTCSTDGAIVCNGDSQFAICDHGKAIWQAVAPGTKCSAGNIVKRGFTHRHQRSAI